MIRQRFFRDASEVFQSQIYTRTDLNVIGSEPICFEAKETETKKKERKKRRKTNLKSKIYYGLSKIKL